MACPQCGGELVDKGKTNDKLKCYKCGIETKKGNKSLGEFQK